MKLSSYTTEVVTFQEDDGRLLAEISLIRHPILINGYICKVVLAQGEDGPKEFLDRLAFSQPESPTRSEHSLEGAAVNGLTPVGQEATSE